MATELLNWNLFAADESGIFRIIGSTASFTEQGAVEACKIMAKAINMKATQWKAECKNAQYPLQLELFRG